MTTEDIKREAIRIIKDNKTEFEQGTCFVTEKIAFKMKEVIRTCRKNYWGIFDKPTDPRTGKKKVWVPLTESTVEATIKNYDTDTKDINWLAKDPKNKIVSKVIKGHTMNKLEEIDFGEKLDDMERRIAIDGTAVWKIWEDKKDGKTFVNIVPVDLLNFYIDPTVNNIQEAEIVIERAIYTPDQVKANKKWMDTKDIKGDTNVMRNDGEVNIGYTNQGTANLVDVYEFWGLAPKSLLTGRDKDKEVMEDIHIIASQIDGKNAKVHLIEKYDGLKPYEEFWYTRVPGRWYGKGVAEKLMVLQQWINMIVNIRLVRATVSQLGIWKIKAGSGITPKQMSKLAVNGALKVNNMDDIEQLAIDEASESSYRDEEVVNSWAERVTSAFEAVTGEQMPATTTATIGAIQSRNARSQFVLIQKGIGMALERVLNRHFINYLQKSLKKQDVVRFTLSLDEIREFDEACAEIYAVNKMTTYESYLEFKQKYINDIKKEGNTRYAKIDSDIEFKDFDIKVFVKEEEVDKNMFVTDLLNMLRVAPEYKTQIIEQVFDILGINLMPAQEPAMLPQQGENIEIPQRQELAQMQTANTLNG